MFVLIMLKLSRFNIVLSLRLGLAYVWRRENDFSGTYINFVVYNLSNRRRSILSDFQSLCVTKHNVPGLIKKKIINIYVIAVCICV